MAKLIIMLAPYIIIGVLIALFMFNAKKGSGKFVATIICWPVFLVYYIVCAIVELFNIKNE